MLLVIVINSWYNVNAVAIVVDPKRTMAAGKVDLECFRAYTNEYAEKKKAESKKTGGSGGDGAGVRMPKTGAWAGVRVWVLVVGMPA